MRPWVRAAAWLTLAGGLSAACGKYGPPLRTLQAPEQVEEESLTPRGEFLDEADPEEPAGAEEPGE